MVTYMVGPADWGGFEGPAGRRTLHLTLTSSLRRLKLRPLRVDCRARLFELSSQSRAVSSEVLQQHNLTAG
eukprot:4936246-Prymnesium_polylepis.1